MNQEDFDCVRIFLVFKSIYILGHPGAATWHDAIFTDEQSFARNQKPVINLWMKYKLGFMSTKLVRIVG